MKIGNEFNAPGTIKQGYFKVTKHLNISSETQVSSVTFVILLSLNLDRVRLYDGDPLCVFQLIGEVTAHLQLYLCIKGIKNK